jgi:hypothetical protein
LCHLLNVLFQAQHGFASFFYDDDESFSRLNGTFLSLHHYGFWNPSQASYSGWVSDFKNPVGSCASRTVVDEWGAPMTTGLDYNGPISRCQ